ncbi:MAG: lipid A deacylase LpxR family protein [Gammaproteobacteria bacterium]|nr:lipid A deacylase LpxR family protein [Gammaproteobacteria bacterium]
MRHLLALIPIVSALTASLCGLAMPATAADSTPWTLNAYFENDLFNETDQNYTNGVRLSWISPDTASFQNDPAFPAWLRAANRQLRLLHSNDPATEHNLVVSLGQLMFTPENTAATTLVPDQRPYAGYLYGGIAYHTRSDQRLDVMELNLGIVGPSARAHESQDFIHDLRGFQKYNGWDNQLRDEPTVQLLYEQKHRLLHATWRGGFGHDFIGHRGVSLGNVATHLNFGGEYRIGWELPDDFGTSAVRAGGDNSAPGRDGPRRRQSSSWVYGLHAFVALDARLVARDIFLDGNTIKDSHSVDRKAGVADLAAGISFLTGRWKISYARVLRTREFDGQPHPHRYGSISLSYSL